MPRGDRTGPNGFGPMTGRGAGYCSGYPAPGYMNPSLGRGRGGFGFGRGAARRWGRGYGRGRGWSDYGYGMGYPYPAVPYYGIPEAAEFTPQQEAEMLKREAKALQDEVGSINRRISELESAAKNDK